MKIFWVYFFLKFKYSFVKINREQFFANSVRPWYPLSALGHDPGFCYGLRIQPGVVVVVSELLSPSHAQLSEPSCPTHNIPML